MPTARWFCDLHRVWTSSDCPKCDAEQIADLERYADCDEVDHAACDSMWCNCTCHQADRCDVCLPGFDWGWD